MSTNTPGTNGTPTSITGNEILNQNAPANVLGQNPVSVQPLTELQRSGLRVLLFLGVFSIFALFGIMAAWYSHVPVTPTISIDSTTNPQIISDTLKTFETFKSASDIAAEQPKQWFDLLFVKMLYPLVTLVLGYIFGAQTKSSETTQ